MATFDNSSLLVSLSLTSFQGLFNFTYDTAALNPIGATEIQEGYVVQIWDNKSSLNPPPQFEGAVYAIDSAIDMGQIALDGVAYVRRNATIGSYSFPPPSFYISTRRGAVIEAFQNIPQTIYVFMRALDTGAGLSGLVPSMVVTASKNGAGGVVISPTVTDLGGSLGAGWYTLAIAGSDLATLGMMALHITALAALPNDDVIIKVVPNKGGQIKPNSFNDKYVYDLTGKMTGCRMRVFADKATADTASDSDADGAHGEVERYRVTVTYNTDGSIKTYEYGKEL